MKKICATVLIISMAILWAGGCQEEQASSGDQKARLIAVENRGLQAQLQAEKNKKDDEIKKLSGQLEKAQALIQAEITKRDNEIKELNAQLQAQMKKRDEDVRGVSRQLEQCEKTRDERLVKEIDKQCEEMVSKLLDWTVELTAENERLKAGQADVNGEPNK
jgi:hypothetical protein